MISDTIENASTYFNLSPRITAALKFLQRNDLDALPLGKLSIDGERLFALVQEYQTKTPDQTFWETHRKYIDVQCVQSGVEAFGWSPIQQMKLKTDYNAERDIIVWEGQGQRILVPKGNFIIFFPHDAHMGGLQIDRPQPVRKIVLKLAVE